MEANDQLVPDEDFTQGELLTEVAKELNISDSLDQLAKEGEELLEEEELEQEEETAEGEALSDPFDLEAEAEEEEELPESAQNQIATLQEELSELKVERDNLRTQVQQAQLQQQGAIGQVSTVGELDTLSRSIKDFNRWLGRHTEGGVYTDDQGQEHDIEPEQVDLLLRKTDEELDEVIPAKRNQLVNAGKIKQQRQQNIQAAVQAFPWMKDKKSPEFQQVAQYLGKYPEIGQLYQQSAIGPLLLGYLAEGIKATRGSIKINGGNKPPRIPGTRSRTTSTRHKSNKNGDLRKKAMETGSKADLEAWIAESLL